MNICDECGAVVLADPVIENGLTFCSDGCADISAQNLQHSSLVVADQQKPFKFGVD